MNEQVVTDAQVVCVMAALIYEGEPTSGVPNAADVARKLFTAVTRKAPPG